MKILFAALSVLAAGVLVGADLTTKSGKVYNDYSIVGVTNRGVTVEHAAGMATVPLSELPDDLREKYAAEVEQKQATAQQEKKERQRAAGLKHITLDMKEGVVCVQVLRSGVIATCGAWDNNFYIEGLNVSNLADESIISQNGNTLRLYCIGTFRYRAVSGVQCTIPRFTVSRANALNYLEKHPDARIIGMQKKVYVPDIGRQLRYENRMRRQNIQPQINRQKYR